MNSANGSFRSSSRPTLKRSGEWICDEISADWAAQRIEGILAKALADGLRRSLRCAQGGAGVKTLIESFAIRAGVPA